MENKLTDFSRNLKISKKMYDCILNAQNHEWSWYEGSSQCGKSVTAAIAFAMIIENSPRENNLFIALGYTQSSAINNIFECGGYGLVHYFAENCHSIKYKGPSGKLSTAIDCLSINTKTGTKIVVPFGASTKTSNQSWHGWTVSGFIFDEIDRCCQESIDEMKQRITTIKHPHIVVTQNPSYMKDPIYKLLDDLLDRKMVYYVHWTLDDNIGMTPELITERKSQYDPTSLFYKRYILGERINPEGQIYTLTDKNYIDDFNPDDYSQYITVCDQGETVSASVFILLAMKYDNIKKQNCLDVLKTYYYKNDGKNEINTKMFCDTANDYANFIIECSNLMHKYPSAYYIDMDPEFYKNCIATFREHDLMPTMIKYVIKDDIEQRIKSDINLIYTGKLRFYKNISPEIIDDFKNAQYDTDKIMKTGKMVRYKQYTELGHLDGIDSIEYGISYFKSRYPSIYE